MRVPLSIYKKVEILEQQAHFAEALLLYKRYLQESVNGQYRQLVRQKISILTEMLKSGPSVDIVFYRRALATRESGNSAKAIGLSLALLKTRLIPSSGHA